MASKKVNDLLEYEKKEHGHIPSVAEEKAEKMSAGSKTPPKEFLLIPYGRMETTKGTFVLTEQAAQEVMFKYKEHGTAVNIDYEHQGLKAAQEGNGPAPAAGWGKLTLKSDGIWLTNVKWTEKAHEFLSNGEYRYFSPAFSVDPETSEVAEVINVAITNLPATHNLEPLVSATNDGVIAVAASRLFPQPIVRLSMKKSLAHHLAAHAKRLGGHHALAKHMGMAPDAVAKHMAGQPPSQEEMACYTTKLGIVHGELENAPIEHASLDGMDVNKSMASPGEDSPNLFHTLNSAGETEIHDSPDEADENDGDVLHGLSAEGAHPGAFGRGPIGFNRNTSDIVSLTGTKDPNEQAGRIAGWKQAASLYANDHKALVTLTQEMDNNKRRELVALGRAQGKLTPPLERFYMSRPVAEFKAFLDVAPVINEPAGYSEPDPTKPENHVMALSRAEQEVVELSSFSDEEVKEYEKMKAIVACTIKPGATSFKTLDSPKWTVALTQHYRNCEKGRGPQPEGFTPRSAYPKQTR